MGFKITTKTLRSIILQEIKKITEGTHGDTPEEDSEDEYEDDYVAPIERPGYQEADPSYEKEIPQKELDGLLSWAKTQGFDPDDWE